MTEEKYGQIVTDFVKGGWNESAFQKFYRAPQTLYNVQIFTPYMKADEGPKAFHVSGEVKPKLWLVLYKGPGLAAGDRHLSFCRGGGRSAYCQVQRPDRARRFLEPARRFEHRGEVRLRLQQDSEPVRQRPGRLGHGRQLLRHGGAYRRTTGRRIFRRSSDRKRRRDLPKGKPRQSDPADFPGRGREDARLALRREVAAVCA